MSLIEREAADMAATFAPEALARQVIGERAARVAAQADEASARQQLRGAVEQLRLVSQEAGDASWQAAFWRKRAIDLGASEDEFRKYGVSGLPPTEGQ